MDGSAYYEMRDELATLLALDWNIYTETLLDAGLKSLGNAIY